MAVPIGVTAPSAPAPVTPAAAPPAAQPAAPPAAQPLIQNDAEAARLAQLVQSGVAPPALHEPIMSALQHYQLNRQGGEPTTVGNVLKSAGRGVAEGAADLVGMPQDLLDAGLRATGEQIPANDMLGSRWFKSFIPPPARPQDNPTLAGVEGATEGVTPAVIPVGAVPGALGRAAAVAKEGIPAASDAVLNAIRAGYRFRPSDLTAAGEAVPQPGAVSRILENVAGPTPLKRDITAANQRASTAQGQLLAPGSASAVLPKDIKAAMAKPAAVYQDTAGQLGGFQTTDAFDQQMGQVLANHDPTIVRGAQPLSATAIKTIQGLMHNPSTEGTVTASGPGALKALQTLRDEGATDAASALEDEMERHLPAGQLPAFRAARQQFAQLYDLRNSTNPTTGQVSAAKIVQQPSVKGRYASGPIGTVAQARQLLPSVTGAPTPAGGGGLGLNLHTVLPIAAAAGAGGAGMHYLGLPVEAVGGMAAAVPAIRALAQQYIKRLYPQLAARAASGTPGAADYARALLGSRAAVLPGLAAQQATGNTP